MPKYKRNMPKYKTNMLEFKTNMLKYETHMPSIFAGIHLVGWSYLFNCRDGFNSVGWLDCN